MTSEKRNAWEDILDSGGYTVERPDGDFIDAGLLSLAFQHFLQNLVASFHSLYVGAQSFIFDLILGQFSQIFQTSTMRSILPIMTSTPAHVRADWPLTT